jgi:hypothetical protein
MKNTNNDIEIIGSEAFGQKMQKENDFYAKLLVSLGLAK